MYRQSLSILLALVLLSGCDDSKRYPTAPAPKTLKVKPMAAPTGMGMDVDDDDADDDDDDGAPMRRRGPTAPSRRLGSTGTLPASPGMVPAPGGPRTRAFSSINGHPEGPKAEVFNAVVNNAFANALGCFAKATSDSTLAFRVKMTVGNGGTVEEATCVSGPPLKEVRSCLEAVVKRLTFPPFKGPKVTQMIPFAAVRQGGGAANP